jgi:UDP-N-acetylmuramyl tripeptide synthase
VIYVITIGVLGSRGKSAVAEIIQGELKKQGKNICIIGTNQESSEHFFEIFQDDVEYVIIAVSREDILYKRIDKIKFDILIQTALEKESSELIEEMQNIIHNIKENGYVIFNSDSIQKINFHCDKVYPITYGLNERTTVTASSIDDMQELCFSYCLQRAVLNISDDVIQPFDMPVIVEGNYEDINYYLAAYTCLLILGYKF